MRRLTRFPSPDQGTTPALSKFWMPLDEFTQKTVEGLVRGDPEVAVGFAATVPAKYTAGMRESLENGYKINQV